MPFNIIYTHVIHLSIHSFICTFIHSFEDMFKKINLEAKFSPVDLLKYTIKVYILHIGLTAMFIHMNAMSIYM